MLEKPLPRSIAEKRYGFAFRAVLAVLSFALFAMAVRSLHVDTQSTFDPEQPYVASAISHVVYGAPLGEVYRGIYSAFVNRPGPAEDGVRDVLNGKVAPADLEEVTPETGNGMGHLVFAGLSMQLFGPHLSSLSYGFLLLMGLSTLAYLVRFQDERTLIVPVFFACVTLMLLTPQTTNSVVVNEISVGSIRYFMVAAFLPSFHLLWEICDHMRGRKHLGRDALALCVQLVVLVLAWLVRGSPVYFFFPAVVFALAGIYLHRRNPAIRNTILLKAGFTFLVSAAAALLIIFSVPSAYFKTGQVTGIMWHRFFVGFANHPDWPFGDLADRYPCPSLPNKKILHLGFDANAACVWVSKGPTHELTSFMGAEYERVLRSATLDVILHYPRQAFETFFYYKLPSIPWMLLGSFNFSHSGPLAYVASLVALQGVILFVFAFLLALGGTKARSILIMPAVLLLYFAFSLIPQLMAWSGYYTSVDLILFAFAFPVFVGCAGVVFVVQKKPVIRKYSSQLYEAFLVRLRLYMQAYGTTQKSNKHPRPPIESLTGLRFIAAFSILVAHGTWWVVLQQDPLRHDALPLLQSFTSFGMTLFFVLSGFVIHYNYYGCLGKNRPGKADFFIARFARLYPLFLLVFAYDFFVNMQRDGYFIRNLGRYRDIFSPLPFHLTFTQTWFYKLIGGETTVYDQLGPGITGVTWSLATEWFFYVAYILAGAWLLRLTTPRRFLSATIVLTLVCWAYFIGIFSYNGAISDWAARHFGEAARNGGESFGHWIYYVCPYGRVLEFFMGALAAQMTLNQMKKPASGAEERIGKWVTPGLAVLIGGVHYAMYSTAAPITNIGSSCYAFLIAGFIYCCARYRNAMTRLLSSPWMIMGGEASYSIYLLHYYVMHEAHNHYLHNYGTWPVLGMEIILCLLVARASYVLFERPAMRFVRANFLSWRMHFWLPVCILLISAMSFIGYRLVHTLQTTYAQAGRIEVSEATMAGNCSGIKNNLLESMKALCDRRDACEYSLQAIKIHNLAPHCDRNAVVRWQCGEGLPQRLLTIASSAEKTKIIQLSCH